MLVMEYGVTLKGTGLLLSSCQPHMKYYWPEGHVLYLQGPLIGRGFFISYPYCCPCYNILFIGFWGITDYPRNWRFISYLRYIFHVFVCLLFFRSQAGTGESLVVCNLARLHLLLVQPGIGEARCQDRIAWVLWAELCHLSNSYVEILNPSTSECDYVRDRLK